MADPYRSRPGLSTRPTSVGGNSDEIQLLIDPIHGDFDQEITGLRKQVRQIKSVAQEIGSEAKFQNDFLNQLMKCFMKFLEEEGEHKALPQMTVIKAQAGLKHNMRRLNRSIIREGSNHVMHVVLFALLCFFVVYLWSKFSRR